MTRAAASVVLVALTLSACGARPNAKLAHGVIEVRSGISGSSLRRSVVGIEVGTRASDVRSKLGEPFAKVSAQGESCWAYHASQPGTALDALDFCIDKRAKVTRILTGVYSQPGTVSG